MWKSTDVDEARPLIVLVVGSTCFTSTTVEEFAATETEPSKSMSSSNNDAVVADAVGLHITMFVTIVVVADGVVYRVVLLAEAAPLNSTLDVVAISYYLPSMRP
jgi:hypothetical protein